MSLTRHWHMLPAPLQAGAAGGRVLCRPHSGHVNAYGMTDSDEDEESRNMLSPGVILSRRAWRMNGEKGITTHAPAAMSCRVPGWLSPAKPGPFSPPPPLPFSSPPTRRLVKARTANNNGFCCWRGLGSTCPSDTAFVGRERTGRTCSLRQPIRCRLLRGAWPFPSFISDSHSPLRPRPRLRLHHAKGVGFQVDCMRRARLIVVIRAKHATACMHTS